MTQSPQKIYFGLKYEIILEQPERKFALSDDQLNLLIMDPDERNFVEYSYNSYKKYNSLPVIFLQEEDGIYCGRVTEVSVSSYNVELPTYCRIKIGTMTTKIYKYCRIKIGTMTTKIYKFEKIIRTGV